MALNLTQIMRVGALLSFTLSSASAQTATEVLARLDRFALAFKGIRATVRYTDHTAPLSADSDTTETGTLTIQRSSPGKVQLMIAFTGSDANTVVLQGQTAAQYFPKLDEIHEYDIRKYRDLYQRLLLLGFGMPGRELAANYEVGEVRRETIESQPSIHLELVPKAAGVLNDLKKVELWIADKTDCAVRQKLYFAGGSYKIAQFSEIEINPKLAASAFDLPKHAKRVPIN